MKRVLVVEDDADISAVVAFNLRGEGYETDIAEHGASALQKLRENPPDAVILDLMLPDISGIDVCREIRRNPETSQLPVLMLTARGQEADRLAGLESGADDYIIKPFSVKELLLRMRAVLRRTQSEGAPASQRVNAGPISIDNVAHRVFVNGNEISLTHTEYRLLLMFVRRPGRVFSRRQLLDEVWDMPGNIVTRTVDTHVKRLREKLGLAGDAIETVRSVGYRYVARQLTAN